MFLNVDEKDSFGYKFRKERYLTKFRVSWKYVGCKSEFCTIDAESSTSVVWIRLFFVLPMLLKR